MIYRILLFSCLLFAVSCSQETEDVDCGLCGENMNRVDAPETIEAAVAMVKEADTSTTGDSEFRENKEKIEAIYGEQYDFCHCVVLNDSLNRVAKSGNFDDNFMDRMEEVSNACKSFLVMDGNRTPEERDKHQKKIDKCLKNNGLK
jgi:hypothetical protein